MTIAIGGLLAVLTLGMALRQTSLETLASPAGVSNLRLPPGFVAKVFAAGLDGPRFIRFGPDGALYVAERGADRIVALSDRNGDGTAEVVRVFADRLDHPHSLVFHREAWYVGVPRGVIRLVDEDGDGKAEQREVLIDNYPTGGHSTRTVEFLPDGRMVVSVGSSCNNCVEDDQRRAAVLVYEGASARGERVFARGLRNAVGLAIHPASGELWATNNGRDWLGDELPPEALYVVRDGLDYGWPRCHNGTIADPEFGGPGACVGVAAPVVNMQAHSAPLGLVFYTGTAFPPEYRGDLFIAFHGSWNRSVPTGYKIVRLPLDGSRPRAPLEDFATGWIDEKNRSVTGRPVGLAVGPDGALYVSDDKAGLVYRISYKR
ncbi:MAG: PQQ-dependent sugar dehydrogenase [Desulfuromonadales bacterium]|nr:PQQ-dependent sugar dehydrogenase [Desulfuromonadales bacterium]